MIRQSSIQQNRLQSPISNLQSPIWPLNIVLAVLFLGPIISPLFRATGLPLLADAGLLARNLLSTYVCPTPERSYMLFGMPMGVCARCWGATIGLLAARTFFKAKGARQKAKVIAWPGFTFYLLPFALRCKRFYLLPFALRHRRLLPFAFYLLPFAFLLWPLEIVGTSRGWWYAPLWLLLLNGAQAGFFAGLFFCSVWKGLEIRD